MASWGTIFRSRNLSGDCLVSPLRGYPTFFSEQIEGHSGCTKVALVIANIVTGIFAYPIFGLLALIGMFIKSKGAEELQAHNQSKIEAVKAQQAALGVEERRYAVCDRSTSGWTQYLFGEFKITKANAAETYPKITACIAQATQ